ncbi:MAG: HAD family hydrolase [Lentisphaerae bacterium]|nr:HAD family hydrolase [Lentisphaerota bacterium]
MAAPTPPPAGADGAPAAVVFDLDGTLLDTIDDLTDAMNAVLGREGYPPRTVEECKVFVGEGAAAFVRCALPADACRPDRVKAVLEAYRAEYAARWARKTRPYPGIPGCLRTLQARGVPMAVLSNKGDALVKQAVARFLPDIRFAAVRGARPDVPLKPEADAVLPVAERLGRPAHRVWLVGDTKTDMQTARAAGMVPVGVLWGFRSAGELKRYGARHLAATPAELIEFTGPAPA